MLTQNMQQAINEQIKNEIYSAYLYLSMSAHFEANNLPGFAQWMRIQSREELDHALKFFDYVNERGGRVTLIAIPKPASEWKTSLEVFNQLTLRKDSVNLVHGE